MIMGFKLKTDDPKRLEKMGFKRGEHEDIYKLAFNVYKNNIISVFYADISSKILNIEVYDKNLDTLYRPYYQEPLYEDLVLKEVKRNIGSKIRTLQENRILSLDEGTNDMGRSRGFEVIGKEQYRKDFGVNEEVVIKLPRRATKGSAGYDCFAPVDIALEPGKDIKVPTGIRAYMKQGEVLMALPRSGLGFKYYCRLANTVGVIDSDYYYSDNEGHIFIKLRNEGDKPLVIRQGEAMCQFIFVPFLLADGDSFERGEERNGGFGSTTK